MKKYKIIKKDWDGDHCLTYRIQFEVAIIKITFRKEYNGWELSLSGGNTLNRNELLFVESILRGLNSNG